MKLINQYVEALPRLKQDFGPTDSWPRFLFNEFTARVQHGSWAITGSLPLIRSGHPQMVPGYVKHRILDVVHPYGDQRA